MEAAPKNPTKAEFLREKMSNMLSFLCDKLEPLRLQFPEHFTDSKEDMLKKFNTFESEEQKAIKDGELFDRTKHFCLNLMGGIEFNVEGNSLEKAQNIMMMRKIVTIIAAQALAAKRLQQAVEEKKKKGEIEEEGEIDLTNPEMMTTLLSEVERLEMQSTITRINMEILKLLKDDDYLRLCLYMNCFVDTVTNL